MDDVIRIGSVNYLNARPLLYGLSIEKWEKPVEITEEYPAQLLESFKSGKLDIALVPTASIHLLPGAFVAGDYGIAANEEVASVCIFSEVPIEQIDHVYLDYQSATSVRLAKILLKEFWQREVKFLAADEDYISKIKGKTAAVIIGDRALQQRPHFKYIYDLATAWKQLTGLPFVFAAWISLKKLDENFIRQFNHANAYGLDRLHEIATKNDVPYYDLNTYFQKNIQYKITEDMKKGLQLFLQKLSLYKF